MDAKITTLAARRQQEDLAWQSNAVIADYLTARLAGSTKDEKAAIKAAREIDEKLDKQTDRPGKQSPRLMDEINALRTRRYADAA